MSPLVDDLAAATTPEERYAIKNAAYQSQFESPPGGRGEVGGWDPSITEGARQTFIDSVTIEGDTIRVEVRVEINGEPVNLGSFAVLNIKNPPILVDDPAGDIIRTWVDPNGVTQERRLREDVLEALKQIVVDATKHIS